MQNDIFDKLRQDLQNDERNIPAVVDELLKHTADTNLRSSLYLQKTRYNNLNNARTQGTLLPSEYRAEVLGVVESMFSYIERVANNPIKPPPSPPLTPPSTPSLKLGADEVGEIINLLIPLMGTASARYALLVSAFGPESPLLSRVELEGNPRVVTTLLVNSLIEYGKVRVGDKLVPALWVLLLKAKSGMGDDKQEKVEGFRPYFE